MKYVLLALLGLFALFGLGEACFPGQSLQTMVTNASAGSVLKVPCGIYRQSVNLDKALTFDGQGCVEIRGSDIWTGWVNAGGGLWTHSGSPDLPDVGGDCRGSDTNPCNWPEQVFLNGVPLTQVASGATPTTGQFKTSGEGGTITIADNPTGQTVEVTTRWEAVAISSSNVTVMNTTIKHLGTPVYLAGIFPNGSRSNVTIRNNHISYIHTSGILVSDSTGWLIENNTLVSNGHHGLAGGGSGIANLIVRGNTIALNNTEDFEPGNSAGGLKVALVNGAVFENNLVHSNAGPGLWCDVTCTNVIYVNNTIYDNEQSGIFYEISSNCRISHNKVWNNGWGFFPWCYGANILISSSDRCEVSDNVVAWGPKQIVSLSQDRPPDNTAPAGMVQVTMLNNVMVSDTLDTDIFFTGFCQDWTPTPDPIYDVASANGGSGNRFWVTGEGDVDGFSWDDSLMDLAACNAEACGSGSNSYLTASEKNAILTAAGIPTTPPAHP